MFEPIKALENKTSMLFNLDFANNTILSWFYFFFLMNDLCLLILAVSAQIFNPSKKAKAEIKIHPVIAEDIK